MSGAIEGKTASYGFSLISFDWPRWHTIEHDNWKLLDGILSAAALDPVKGLWTIGEVYQIDDRVIDPDDGSIWEAVNVNTASGTTFAAYRLAHPSDWQVGTSVFNPSLYYNKVNVDNLIAPLATITALNAVSATVSGNQTAVTNSINDLQNQITTLSGSTGGAVSGKVAKSGDSMTGNLTFSSDNIGITFSGGGRIVDRGTTETRVVANGDLFAVTNEADNAYLFRVSTTSLLWGSATIWNSSNFDPSSKQAAGSYAAAVHGHQQSDIVGLAASLAAKADDTTTVQDVRFGAAVASGAASSVTAPAGYAITTVAVGGGLVAVNYKPIQKKINGTYTTISG